MKKLVLAFWVSLMPLVYAIPHIGVGVYITYFCAVWVFTLYVIFHENR